MAYDGKTVERVRSVLRRRRNVVERKMMGTLSFVVDGSLCCCVQGDSLMVRVDDERRTRALAEPHVKPMRMGRRSMRSFVLVGPRGIATDASLERWIERGIAAGAESGGEETG